MQQFMKLGCPQLLSRSRGQVLRSKFRDCAVFFNSMQDTLDFVLTIDELAASTSHSLSLHVHNPRGIQAASSIEAGMIFSLSIYQSKAGLDFAQIPVPIESDIRDVLLRLQSPLTTVACAPLLPVMEAEIHASNCLIDGLLTTLSIGFIMPVFTKMPVFGELFAPVGYQFPWVCNFRPGSLALPGDRKLEYIDPSLLENCTVSPDGRSISFIIQKNLKAVSVWNYFTFRIINPTANNAPTTSIEATFALTVGDHAAGAEGTIGVPCPPLKVFADLEMHELPFTYNERSWALMLQLRVITNVPAGGYVVVHAPLPFAFPEDQCRGENATYAEEPGSPAFVPAITSRPFRPILEAGQEDLPLAVPLRAVCSVQARASDPSGSELLIINIEVRVFPHRYSLICVTI
jgi:hypothetical protein